MLIFPSYGRFEVFCVSMNSSIVLRRYCSQESRDERVKELIHHHVGLISKLTPLVIFRSLLTCNRMYETQSCCNANFANVENRSGFPRQKHLFNAVVTLSLGELDTTSKKNRRGVTLGIRPKWRIIILYNFIERQNLVRYLGKSDL